MIKHFVLFQLKEEYSPEEKKTVYEAMKEGFGQLASKIDVLRKLEVHRNINPREEYDIVLVAYVESKDELNVYNQHPDHLEKIEKLIKPHLKHRAALDIWVS